MLYYVRTGNLDCSTNASSHREAAMKSLRNSREDLGVLVIVSEREIGECDESNRYFFTQNILDDCSMRLVG